MTRRSQPPEWLPRHGGPIPVKRGLRGTYDPFYVFKDVARDSGKPYQSPEPKAERVLLALLGTRAAMVVMSCLLAAVVVTLLFVLVIKL